MGATGVCWDNAAAESFFGSLKRELAHRQRRATRAEARRAVIRWIEGWFNSRRLHSSLNYRTPIETETNWYRRQTRQEHTTSDRTHETTIVADPNLTAIRITRG